uniref:Uncharacterized protein n=1 Tax=Carcinus maenas virus 1 TaxID=2704945 RepID=A0A6G9HD76_9VIRU|nr:hypothetical protein [Carcinus maenas virus 1]
MYLDCQNRSRIWASKSTIDLPTELNSVNICISAIEFINNPPPAAKGSISLSVLQLVFVYGIKEWKWIPFVCEKIVYITKNDLEESNVRATFDKSEGLLTMGGAFNRTFKKNLYTDVPHIVKGVCVMIRCHGCIKSVLLKIT